jgi:hypothetical protein
MRSDRPAAVVTHSRTCQGGSWRTCWVCPHSRSATQSSSASRWNPVIRRGTAWPAEGSGCNLRYPAGAAVSARTGRRAPPALGWVSSPPTERFQFPLWQEPPVVGVGRHPPHGRRRHEHERPPGGCHVLRHAPFASCPVIEGPSRPRGTPARLCEFSIHDSPGRRAHWGHARWPPPNRLPVAAIPAPGVRSSKLAQPEMAV